MNTKIDIDSFYLLRDLAEFIKEDSAEQLLRDLNAIYPEQAKALSNAVLEDHSRDYDKKKAALLNARKS